MKKKLIVSALGVLLTFGVLSCQKISTDSDLAGLVGLQSIPLEYGQLKAVTVTDQYPGWAQLWFQDEAGTVRMVRINWQTNQALQKTLTITRTASGGN